MATANQRVVQRVLEEQFKERDFVIGRGAYIVPDYLTVYRSTSEGILFKDRKALARLRGEGGKGDGR